MKTSIHQAKIELENGSSAVLRGFEEVHLLSGRSWIIHFDLFCAPEKLRIDVSDGGDVTVWGQEDYLRWMESPDRSEPGIDLASIPLTSRRSSPRLQPWVHEKFSYEAGIRYRPVV